MSAEDEERDGGELDATVHLEIRCMSCKNAEGYSREVPKYLVSGLLIGFHSSHEGHQLEVVVDGVVYLPQRNRM